MSKLALKPGLPIWTPLPRLLNTCCFTMGDYDLKIIWCQLRPPAPRFPKASALLGRTGVGCGDRNQLAWCWAKTCSGSVKTRADPGWNVGLLGRIQEQQHRGSIQLWQAPCRSCHPQRKFLCLLPEVPNPSGAWRASLGVQTTSPGLYSINIKE